MSLRVRTIKHSFLILLALAGFSFYQGDAPKSYTIRQPYQFFVSDNIGNAYLVNGDELTKYNSNGALLKRYSNKKLGLISYVDATSPLKILLYYKDFQQIAFLDNQLSPNGDPISLEGLGFEQTDLVCSSFNNSFWIYNKQNAELVRFDEKLNILVRTGNLKRILDSDLRPNFILEYNGNIYMNCPQQGIYMFDIYGTFYKVIPLKNLTRMQVDEKRIYYFSKGQTVMYNTETLQESNQALNDTSINSVSFEKERFFRAYKDSIVVDILK